MGELHVVYGEARTPAIQRLSQELKAAGRLVAVLDPLTQAAAMNLPGWLRVDPNRVAIAGVSSEDAALAKTALLNRVGPQLAGIAQLHPAA